MDGWGRTRRRSDLSLWALGVLGTLASLVAAAAVWAVLAAPPSTALPLTRLTKAATATSLAQPATPVPSPASTGTGPPEAGSVGQGASPSAPAPTPSGAGPGQASGPTPTPTSSAAGSVASSAIYLAGALVADCDTPTDQRLAVGAIWWPVERPLCVIPVPVRPGVWQPAFDLAGPGFATYRLLDDPNPDIGISWPITATHRYDGQHLGFRFDLNPRQVPTSGFLIPFEVRLPGGTTVELSVRAIGFLSSGG